MHSYLSVLFSVSFGALAIAQMTTQCGSDNSYSYQCCQAIDETVSTELHEYDIDLMINCDNRIFK